VLVTDHGKLFLNETICLTCEANDVSITNFLHQKNIFVTYATKFQ